MHFTEITSNRNKQILLIKLGCHFVYEQVHQNHNSGSSGIFPQEKIPGLQSLMNMGKTLICDWQF